MSRIDLKQDWMLRSEDLGWGLEKALDAQNRQNGWMEVSLPCDIHMPLVDKGIIKEPLEADYSFECEWTEDKSWWFKRVFEVDDKLLNDEIIEMTLESLDAEADIFLNGVHLAHHRSAFYPFKANIKKYLKMGENTLLVRVTTGVEHYSENDMAYFNKYIPTEGVLNRGEKRRIFVRKPQYSFGWDWGPRVATCGIVKGAWIESFNKLAIRNVHTFTRSISNDAIVAVEIEVESFHPFSTLEAELKLNITYDGNSAANIARDVLLKSGINYIRIEANINAPRLWWPNGMGEQPLYSIEVSASAGDVSTDYPAFKFGLRTVELNLDKLDGDDRKFAFMINGVEVFSKGANWIPADSIYARVTDEKYDYLIREAKEANFNMLRVWGGGLYEPDIFYEKCDEYGIMLWHDFMFACALYPDNIDWFQTEFEREADYQTRRLRNHASLVLWCGNNENHGGYVDWWKEPEFFGGAECYNHIAPRAVQRNCPHTPYWNSSPYGGAHPNDNNTGDRHHWWDCMMNPDMNKRITPEEYDRVEAKFVSEYGYIGPCRKSSIIQYHAGVPLDIHGKVWSIHNNTFEKETVLAGIEKHYRDVEDLDMDNYLLYAGLCQGMMYGYSLEALRFKQKCYGSLFWMYDDCWGEVGWTIIDYYLRRKASYYFVKRAFQPVKLILRDDGDIVRTVGINETNTMVEFSAEWGYMSFDGERKIARTTTLRLEPFSRQVVLEFEKSSEDLTKGVCYVMPERSLEKVLPAILRSGTFRELDLPVPRLSISAFEQDRNSVSFDITSDKYAHAVHFELGDDIRLSDEYFDLMPGETRKIFVYSEPEKITFDNINPKCILR